MNTNKNKIKVKMDGQEHELVAFELDNNNRSLLFDLESSINIQVDDLNTIFDKKLEIKGIGCDDDYVKARIDTFFVDDETNTNYILGISY